MTPAARPPNRATSAEAADPAGIDLYQLLVMVNINDLVFSRSKMENKI
jgi:hypothetical protein|tara:strand:- start:320 stop:463 length:144 start_codon:yes stop_codon:yes gene_type:complete